MNSGILNKVIALSKRRGFVYPSSEIYGGLANTWDFGHYGYLLKKNIQELWWKTFVEMRDDMIGIDASIFLSPKVWEASGHIKGFNDALVDCKNCKVRTRADHLIENSLADFKAEGLSPEKLTEIIKKNNIVCPNCKSNNLTDVRPFNLLFETHLGIIEGSKSKIYLRGELAQGIFINFKNVVDSMRIKIPFGIAQVGKAFRNEITMGQFVHRTLEFDLMEFEYFVRKEKWKETFEMWQEEMLKFAIKCGFTPSELRWREHEKHERAFYSSRTADLEYRYPFGWKELFGIAYRSDYDLSNHERFSGKDLKYKDPITGEKYIPHVIEPTFGLSRLTGAVMINSYREESIKGKERIFLAFPPEIAPVKASVFPLQKDERLRPIACKIFEKLKKHFMVEFDDIGNIGKMYRRADEIGTPFCITVDYQTIDDNSVTVRYRDTLRQDRVQIGKLLDYLFPLIEK